MLHILMNSPFSINFDLMLRMLNSKDSIIAMQDGVIISIKEGFFIQDIVKTSVNLYLLKEDVTARGISNFISHEFKLIDYSDFIILTEKYEKQMNW